jgi:hypothetical protein
MGWRCNGGTRLPARLCWPVGRLRYRQRGRQPASASLALKEEAVVLRRVAWCRATHWHRACSRRRHARRGSEVAHVEAPPVARDGAASATAA